MKRQAAEKPKKHLPFGQAERSGLFVSVAMSPREALPFPPAIVCTFSANGLNLAVDANIR